MVSHSYTRYTDHKTFLTTRIKHKQYQCQWPIINRLQSDFPISTDRFSSINNYATEAILQIELRVTTPLQPLVERTPTPDTRFVI